jgi:hypothetical protein
MSRLPCLQHFHTFKAAPDAGSGMLRVCERKVKDAREHDGCFKQRARPLDAAFQNGALHHPTIITLWHLAKALGIKVRALFDEPVRGGRSSA